MKKRYNVTTVIHETERWLCPTVRYRFVCTYEGCPERGPSYASGGEPAEAAEFELYDSAVIWTKEHGEKCARGAWMPVQKYLDEQFYTNDVFMLCEEAHYEEQWG